MKWTVQDKLHYTGSTFSGTSGVGGVLSWQELCETTCYVGHRGNGIYNSTRGSHKRRLSAYVIGSIEVHRNHTLFKYNVSDLIFKSPSFTTYISILDWKFLIRVPKSVQ